MIEKEKKEFKKINYKEYYFDLEETCFSDYCNFNLQNLAQKIKTQAYRPKPRMLYL